MGNRVIIFPAGKEAVARAYAAWTDEQWAAIYEPGGTWAYVRTDIFGQWVVPFLGPPQTWNGVEIPEPAGGAAMRADGVEHDFAVYPDADGE